MSLLSSDNENTLVLYGDNSTTDAILQFHSHTKERLNSVASLLAPSVVVGVEDIWRGIYQMKQRGVEIRFVTEITKENLAYCKEFMNYVELRHLDNVRGNMVITDSEYIATATLSRTSAPHAIFSNAVTLIDQQRLFFENLWTKSIPAEQRIRQIEEGIEPIRTVIINEADEIASELKKSIENSKEIVVCSQFGGMQMIYANFFDLYKKVLERNKKGEHRGIKWIVPVTKQSMNLIYF